MTEEIQGPKGPHGLQASVNPLEQAQEKVLEAEDFGTFGGPGTAPAVENEPAD